MAKNINLLPIEMSTGKEVGKFIRTLKTINFIALLLTIVIAGGGVAAHYMLTSQLSSIESDKITLTSTIKNLETTEQSLVLLKDRLQKINQVLSIRTIEDSYITQKQIVDDLPVGASVKESEIASDKSNLSVMASSSRDVVEITKNLTDSKFKKVFLDSVTFTPLIGYLLSFKLQ
jgi:hypothetical protein